MLVAAWYISILLTVGAASAARALAHAPRWPKALLTWATLASSLLVAMSMLRLWTQTREAFGTDVPLEWSQVSIILFDTPWGGGWLWQGGTALVTWLLVLAWRSRWSLWPTVAVSASIAAFTAALNGHAVGMDDGVWITVLAHGLHVIAAGWWMGGLAIVQMVTRDADVERDVQDRLSLSTVINRFSTSAVAAVSLLILSGIVATWRHVIEPVGFDGFASPYGLALLTKIGVFCAAALCGLYNWRVLSPRLAGDADAARQLRAIAWLEVSLGLMAIVLTALIGTMSMPEPPGGH